MTIREIIYSLAKKNGLAKTVLSETHDSRNRFIFRPGSGSGTVTFHVIHDYGAIAVLDVNLEKPFTWSGIRSDLLWLSCFESVHAQRQDRPLLPHYLYSGGPPSLPPDTVFFPDLPVRGIVLMVLEDHYEEHLLRDHPGAELSPGQIFSAVNGLRCPSAFPQISDQIRGFLPAADPVYEEIFFESKFNELMVLFSGSLPESGLRHRSRIPEDDLLAVSAVTAYIDEHLHESPGLAALARHVYMSPSKLKSLFREVTGYSISEYRSYRRIYVARHLLETTGMPVSAIARRCGYQKPSNFNTFFQKYMDMSPREYREAAR